MGQGVRASLEVDAALLADPRVLPSGRRSRHHATAMANVVRLILRLALGALFLFSGINKLRDPGMFAFSVNAFKLGLPEPATVLLAFAFPWIEVVAGACLVLGCWTRSAAFVVAVLMIGFIGGIISLQVRQMDVECPCFGKFEVMCTGPMGTCHIIRNAILAAVAATVMVIGSGAFALRRDQSPR